MLDHSFSRLAVVGVVLLIAFLAYASQYFLLYSHLSEPEYVLFNICVACIWITYARSILTSPGSPPVTWTPVDIDLDNADAEDGSAREETRSLVSRGAKWCRKCNAYKPPRCHHCKTCGVCVVRMDHHCPWTNNCVGWRNFPHFLKFLGYSAFTCCWLFCLLVERGWEVWVRRDLPSYMSPHTFLELCLLAVLLVTDLLVAFSLSLLFIRTLWSTGEGYTTIETWEQDRHNALVRQKRVRRQQFPYDIGTWDNLCSAFCGSSNIMGWFWPLSRTKEVGVEIKGSDGLKLKGGLEWELNGYEVVGATWPPLDPDKGVWMGANAPMPAAVNDGGDWAEGVRRRQKEDMERREGISRPQDAIVTSAISNGSSKVIAPKWMNEEGETLADYGVDDDDEDVPLAELMRKRAGWGKSNTD
ncbi:unnamed protein product [Tuber melanosporum]|uniref:Palmitoyltransferase PFA4 n=1 Tax=Tuber melanosporum (strain Mel28) TaxID=656061 RepID=D5GFW6_TUBMM|nr:uncharacterized protein GSTUM_00007118001 [Tuber melanosporum]CAZ83409.1 unnamed protein product [Tuber melanosporum]